MKELHIVRHGKSSWDYENISDEDRPLAIRGIKNTYDMAQRLVSKSYTPELLITSPANRALYTAVIFSKVMGIPFSSLVIDERLYMAYEEEIIDLLHEVDDTISSLMIFGHNPSFTGVANEFVKKHISNMPTAAVVTLKFETDKWNKIEPSNLVFEQFNYPKKK